MQTAMRSNPVGGTLLDRRRIMLGGVAVLLASRLPVHAASDPGQLVLTPKPMPDLVHATRGVADLGDVKLAYWDTGGTGPVVVLLHPGTGSHAIWGYQQPVFAKAGYRVISYSRRGYLDSEAGPLDKKGSLAEDLRALVDVLGIGRFHAVGVAAGGIAGVDFAISYSPRLLSLVVACSIGGVTDPSYVKVSESLRPKGFAEMPPEFRELGPAYRAANPEGVARWLELEHKAVHTSFRQPTANKITLEALGRIAAPTLLMTGDADLWTPPTLLPTFAKAIRQSEMAVIDGAGHSAHWEQPDQFNGRVLEFIGRNRP
jgi:pimeloyl-ACP methyl ester carboxylesterase